MRFALACLALAAAAAPAAAEPMPGAQVAALTAGDRFVFRGFARTGAGFENHIWRFSPAGRVRSESALSRLALGGMGEQFGITAAGTWWRRGERLCLAWEPAARRFDGCYTLLYGPGRMIYLVGPQYFEGTLEPAGAAAPSRAAERDTAKPRGR